VGPAHRSRFRSRALLRSAIVLRGLGHGTGRAEAFVLWGLNAHKPIALSFLPACRDFDIEKMRPGWRDEMYQSWWAVRQMRLKSRCAQCEQLFLVRPGRRGLLSAPVAKALS
jgi:hypothetical protein